MGGIIHDALGGTISSSREGWMVAWLFDVFFFIIIIKNENTLIIKSNNFRV